MKAECRERFGHLIRSWEKFETVAVIYSLLMKGQNNLDPAVRAIKTLLADYDPTGNSFRGFLHFANQTLSPVVFPRR
jgi:hypothetical protein